MKKSTWIIIGLVAVLGLTYFFTKPQKVSVGVKKLELPAFDQAKIDRIEISTKDKPVILTKQEQQWFLELMNNDKTLLVKADNAAVESMLEATRALSPAYYISELEQKHNELGLNPEAASIIKLHAQGPVVWSLVIGKSDPKAGRYAKMPDDKNIYAVRGSYNQIFKRAEDWRERHVLRLPESELVSVNFERLGKTQLALKKAEDDKLWLIDTSKTPVSETFRVEERALSSLVRGFLSLRAQAFVDNASLSKLPEPLASIYFKTKDKPEQSIQIYPHAGDNYWVKSSLEDQIYEINKSSVDRLFRPIQELRALNIMNLDTKNINKIIMPGKARVVLEKSQNAWKISEPTTLPKDFEFDPEAADNIINLIADLKADRLAILNKDKASDLQRQKAALIELIGPENTKTSFYITKSKNNPELYLVQGNIDSEIYIVPRSKILRLLRGLDAFKKEAFELPPIDERTQGFDSLPVEVQRKLLDSMKKKPE